MTPDAFHTLPREEAIGIIWRVYDPVLKAIIPLRDGEKAAVDELAKVLGNNVNLLEFPARYGRKEASGEGAGNTRPALDIADLERRPDDAR